ncbi:aminoglycoside phosphotransferase family protein [Georgenia halophila]
MPAAEVDVDAALVRRLLIDQHPDLAELPLELANNGWDNVVWRLGEDLAVRVPRRAVAAGLIENEQRWLPEIAGRVRAAVPVALPVPVRVGRPTADCPWPWSVVPWVAGVSAATVPVRSRAVVAEPLAAVVRAMHVPAPADAPYNAVRADPLITRDEPVRSRLAGGGVPRAAQVEALWTELAATEAWSGPPTWLHGDLHPHNLVLDDDAGLAAAGSDVDGSSPSARSSLGLVAAGSDVDGSSPSARSSLGLVAAGSDVDGSSPSARSSLGLVAVVDFGDMTAGDPATDLATAWLTFDAAGRKTFRGCLDGLYDDATWRRARGWALSMATAMVTMSDDEPIIARVGRETLDQVLAG